MRTGSWKKIVCAACLSLTATGTYRAAASSRPCVAPAPAVTREQPLLRGRGLVRFGGYELNVAFTAEGRFVRFDITDVPSKGK